MPIGRPRVTDSSFDVTCAYCGNNRHAPSYREADAYYFKKGYCSKECEGLAKRIECKTCGKLFTPSGWAWRRDPKFCCSRCYWDSRKGLVVNRLFGEDNPKWNPDKKSRTYPSGYLKERTKERDGYACVLCGSMERLHVHHIDMFKDVLKHRLSNLITLCHDCHWDLHRMSDDEYELRKEVLTCLIR